MCIFRSCQKEEEKRHRQKQDIKEETTVWCNQLARENNLNKSYHLDNGGFFIFYQKNNVILADIIFPFPAKL